MLTLDDLKAFARIDGDHDDATLGLLLEAASEFVQGATGRDFSEAAPERARMAVLSLAAFWYDVRMPVGEGRIVPLHVRSLIHQLRDWQDPAVTGASA